ncbi:glycosyltransferase [Undibacterium arcticum]
MYKLLRRPSHIFVPNNRNSRGSTGWTKRWAAFRTHGFRHRTIPTTTSGVYATWLPSSLGCIVREKHLAQSFKPDVVIASSTYPMDIWPARRIAKLAQAKLVYEVHDLWPLSPMELGGMSKWHPFIMLVQAAEDYAYRHADVVISMLPKVQEYMQSRGLAPHKLHIVPNGIDPTEWLADGPVLQGEADEVLSRIKGQGLFRRRLCRHPRRNERTGYFLERSQVDA